MRLNPLNGTHHPFAFDRSPVADSAARPGADDSPPVPRWFHFLALAWVVAALSYARFSPRAFPLVTAEDGLMEWLTVGLFATAGVAGIRRAIAERRVFDFLVALFCLFVAGEEFSWGQRLLGYTPPEFFLENNKQQEFNLHNMARPRKLFSAAMLGFGFLLPLAWRFRPARWLMERLGASAPPLALLPWALAAVLLTQWDPHKVTSEWAECLAGSIFFLALRRPSPTTRRWLAPVGIAIATIALTGISSLQRGGGATLARCATLEVEALLSDIASGRAATPALWSAERVDKQLWQASGHGEVDLQRARDFLAASCEGDAPGTRRRFAVDPWGVSYWLAIHEAPGARRVIVYSLGPNRRLDGTPGAGAGDDIARVTELAIQRQEVGGEVK